jgi:hypothetical protein
VAKIIVIAVPEEDSFKLRPQLMATSPIVIEESFQALG